jgi:hypothetical protein
MVSAPIRLRFATIFPNLGAFAPADSDSSC